MSRRWRKSSPRSAASSPTIRSFHFPGLPRPPRRPHLRLRWLPHRGKPPPRRQYPPRVPRFREPPDRPFARLPAVIVRYRPRVQPMSPSQRNGLPYCPRSRRRFATKQTCHPLRRPSRLSARYAHLVLLSAIRPRLRRQHRQKQTMPVFCQRVQMPASARLSMRLRRLFCSRIPG